MSEFFKIDSQLMSLAEKAEEECAGEFKTAEEIAKYNGEKVLRAFIKNKVPETALHGTTGYGYDDKGRDILDKVYADAFGTEDALVRFNFVNGTHAISTALYGILRPGDRLLMCTGAPYDTLEEIVGKRGNPGGGSLRDYKIEYDEVDLLPDGMPDIKRIAEKSKGAKIAYIQRSRGYSTRPSYTVSDIEKIIKAVKSCDPNVIVAVDNCYGEFVEKSEPSDVGADIMMGSLIKNPGGGIARTGGYIAGRKDLTELCAYRLTCVGMGREIGCTLGQNREMYLGFFLAPQTVMSAVKTSLFACRLFELLGYESLPKSGEPRTDIIASIIFKNEDTLCSFIRGIQHGAPVDSFLTPEPVDTPGYESKIIMGAGAFTMGSSIELSADAPLRPPYAAWLQGGLTYPTGRMGVILAVQNMLDEKTIVLRQY